MADTVTPATPTPKALNDLTPEEYREAQRKDWNTYVALTDISYGGVLAYHQGTPVPASNVERHGYLRDGLVAKVESKAGQAAAAESAEPPGGPVDLAPIALNVPISS